jgi:hypothetical protein
MQILEECRCSTESVQPYVSEYSIQSLLSTIWSEHAIYGIYLMKYSLKLYSWIFCCYKRAPL